MAEENTSGSKLSPQEEKLFLRIISESIEVSKEAEFKAWARGSLRKLFPHDMLICGRVRSRLGKIDLERLLAVDFPLEYLEAVRARHGAFVCPTLSVWLRERTPQFFEADQANSELKAWTPEFNRYELANVASHGMVDTDSRGVATYFSFSRVHEPLSARHAYLLQLLLPNLHATYARVTHNAASVHSGPRPTFSDREVALLSWLVRGKSNWEIAKILQRSPSAVKHAVARILSKLEVANRVQAAAKVLELGILSEE